MFQLEFYLVQSTNTSFQMLLPFQNIDEQIYIAKMSFTHHGIYSFVKGFWVGFLRLPNITSTLLFFSGILGNYQEMGKHSVVLPSQVTVRQAFVHATWTSRVFPSPQILKFLAAMVSPSPVARWILVLSLLFFLYAYWGFILEALTLKKLSIQEGPIEVYWYLL